MDALIANARFHFHKQLFETNTLTLTTAGVASNADTSSRGSKAIARRIVDILVEEQHHAVSTVDKISGQTLGKQFETLTMEFLRETFPYLQNLRPGNWTILQLGNNNKLKTSDFAQYEHHAYLNALTTQNAQLAAALGRMITSLHLTLLFTAISMRIARSMPLSPLLMTKSARWLIFGSLTAASPFFMRVFLQSTRCAATAHRTAAQRH